MCRPRDVRRMGVAPASAAERTDNGKAATASRTVHICAASEDDKIVDALRKHLAGVHVTHAGDLLLGEDESAGRRKLIEAAAVIVLLVSADYVASAKRWSSTRSRRSN